MRLPKSALLFSILGLGLFLSSASAGQTFVSISEFCRVDLGFPIESSPAGGDWPMFRQNAKHTGTIDALPALVYVGSNDLSLHAIKTDNCSKAWQFRTGGAVKSSPAVQVSDEGLVEAIYVGSDDGTLYAINADGTRAWQFVPESREAAVYKLYPPPGVVRSSPLLRTSEVGSKIVFGSDDGNVYFVQSPATEIARFPPSSNEGDELRGSFRSSPNYDSEIDQILIGSFDRVLYSLGNITNTQNWFTWLDGPIDSSPAIADDGSIYISTNTGTLFSIRFDSIENWRARLGGDVLSSPAIGNDGTIFTGTEAGIMHAIRPNGTPLCTFRVLGPDGRANTGDESLHGIRSSAAITPDGLVIFGANDGYLYVIDEDTCQLRASFKTNGPIVSSPLVAMNAGEKRVMFGSGDGKFYILSLN